MNEHDPASADPDGAARRRRVIVLGSTGSIGTQTLEVIEHLNTLHARNPSGQPTRFEVVGLAAGRNEALVRQQADRFDVTRVALGTGSSHAQGLVEEVECDLVVGAMVGAAGLPATLAAVRRGRDVALANKETLVAAGALIVPASRASGSRLLPIDSEHSAIWQCLQGRHEGTHPGAHGGAPCPPLQVGREVSRIVLTASGGPFRTRSREEVYHATPAQALAHPTWSMGPKVSIDSASLTNKAFEIIEAAWLFGLARDRISVLIHPQSMVHSLVEFADGSVMAQLGAPDMRAPIQYALTFPRRPDGRARRIDLGALSRLEFSVPDPERFPALELAYRVIERGGTSGAIFNAASEAAVEAFLHGHVRESALAHAGAHGGGGGHGEPVGRIPFGRMVDLAGEAMEAIGVSPVRDLADVLDADAQARAFVRSRLA